MSVVEPLLAYSLARLSNYKNWGFRWKEENRIVTLGLEGWVFPLRNKCQGLKNINVLIKNWNKIDLN